MRGGNERKTKRARELRKVDNEAEDILWHELRGRRLNGHKFVRQMPIGPYFADLACREAIGGSRHWGARVAPEARDQGSQFLHEVRSWLVLAAP